MNNYILDDNNNLVPCSLKEWCNFNRIENPKRFVKQQTVDNHFVSTVFLGIDHNPYKYGDDVPHFFETMVFEGEDTGIDIYRDRYPTYEDALKGHEKAVQWVKDGCKPDEIK